MGKLVSRLVKFAAGPPRGHVGWLFRGLEAAEAIRNDPGGSPTAAETVSLLDAFVGDRSLAFGIGRREL